MVHMKSFQVIILLSSLLFLTNCASSKNNAELSDTQGQFIDVQRAPLNLDESMMYAVPGYLWNASQYLRFSLKKKEKNQHRSAVYQALEHLPNGKIVAWYSKERKVSGKVRIIHSYPQSGGYCRVYQSFIKVNGATRHTTNAACKEMGRYWRFVK